MENNALWQVECQVNPHTWLSMNSELIYLQHPVQQHQLKMKPVEKTSMQKRSMKSAAVEVIIQLTNAMTGFPASEKERESNCLEKVPAS